MITDKLIINPTETRRKEEYPKISIDMGLAHTSWSLEIKDEVSRAVSFQMDKLIEKLQGKEKLIKELCDKYDLETTFTIVINTENALMPELVLTRENIAFASSINAEVVFDIYEN